MKQRPPRGAFTVLTFLALAISFDSSPSLTVPPKVTRPAPDPRAIALVDELRGRSALHDVQDSRWHVLRREDLDAALSPSASAPGIPGTASSRHGFDLFDAGPQRADLDVLQKLPFGRAMLRAAERHRVDPLLLAAIVETESAFAPDAVSREGAIGLMQLIPETGELYGKTDLFDPYVNLEVGSQYIGALLERYHGDLALALAAYNCGPAVVTRYGRVPPFAETRDFVKSVLALYVDHRQSAWKRSQERADRQIAQTGERGGSLRGRDRLAVPQTPVAHGSSLQLGR
ncbi:MAG TPA: lytic transglycosylase domain-containing protein [Thermoanaerobaculia bacterium]|nr:lytic transglycosylase domain-containing protein [Thermoanaerobaculia bacterium]